MVSVYCTEGAWFCSTAKSVKYYKNLQEAMDAAYRQTANHGAAKSCDRTVYDG